MEKNGEGTSEIAYLRSEVRRLRKALNDVTPSLPALLKRRGFRIYRQEPSDDLLVPADTFIDGYYEMLKRYSFRPFLRDVIKHQRSFTPAQVTRFATKKVTGEYLDYLSGIGMALAEGSSYRLDCRPIRSFGATLEWFLAEIFKREFSTEAVYGVKIKRPLIGGDYDLLAKIDGSILYMEIKSSPPRQIYQTGINAFLDRVYDLMPEIAIFFDDTELRMKDKIVPMFEDGLRARGPKAPDVVRIEKELFGINTERTRVFIINAKDSITRNIERVLLHYFRHPQNG